MNTEEGEPVASFSSPSVPLKVGYTHQKCVGLLTGIGIKKWNVSIKENAVKFKYKLEWDTSISTISLKFLSSFNKVQLLPVKDDLMIIGKFMKKGIKIHLRST